MSQIHLTEKAYSRILSKVRTQANKLSKKRQETANDRNFQCIVYRTLNDFSSNKTFQVIEGHEENENPLGIHQQL